MGKSRISFQIDECFIKSVRNESKRRREHFLSEGLENVQDFKNEFVKLGLTFVSEQPELKMKKKVIRALISK